MASFVSANELSLEREQRKNKQRHARKEILEEAQESFIKEKRRRELKEERGDDKWIAPGLDKRLEYSYQKKKKKHKKHKKHHGGKDTDEEEMWVETTESKATPTINAVPIERQEWMKTPMGPSSTSIKLLEESTAAIEAKEKRNKPPPDPINSMGQHPRELNPYWKDGGRGLPEENNAKTSNDSVGDGGRSWLLRSYKRALEQSKQDNVSIEEIADKRWGSLDKLYSLLKDADIDPTDPDSRPSKGRKHYLYSRHDKETSSRSTRDYRRPIERPSYEPFKPSRGFVQPSDDNKSHHNSSSSSSSHNWKKMTNSTNDDDYMQHSSRDLSPTPPPVSTTPPHTSPPVSPPVQYVTDTQLNSLGAKLLKAELIGDKGKIDKLKNKLEELRRLQKCQKYEISNRKEEKQQQQQQQQRQEEVILLAKTDRYGNVRPIESPSNFQRGPPKKHTHTEKGKRNKYFADDDNYSLKNLIEQERSMTAQETHLAIAKMASKFVPSSNYDETVDDVLDNKSVLKHDPRKEEHKLKMKAMSESRAMNEALRNCKMCVGNECFEKHLMIALGIEVYLAIPSQQPLIEGHCLLVPREHTACSLQMDENVWSEIGIFRKGLTKMFADRGMDVVFTEMYSSVHGNRHMFIECIPLPKEAGELAPMYFKKAIQESDVEWSDNKKLIDTSNKGVRGSLPNGLPYFFVEFGTDGGFGHVIEDQSKFPWYFGKEVCGGIIDCEPRLWLKPQRDTFERQKLRAIQLSSRWKDYDWTQKLNE